MDPGTLLHGRGRVTDRIAVFNDVLALGQIAERHLVAARNILQQRNRTTVDLERLALLQIVGNGHSHIVRRIDFQQSFHVRSYV